MARACGWCSSPRRAGCEERLLAGESIRLVSASMGVSESATYRHLRNHMRPGVLVELRQREGTTQPEQIGARLLRILRDVDDIKAHARATSDGRLMLAACNQEREALGVLMNRLGIDDQTVVEDLEEARALIYAVRTCSSSMPGMVLALANAVRDQAGGSVLADALVTLAESSVPPIKELS